MNRLVERFLFEMPDSPLPLRFNIAPSQPVAAIRIMPCDQTMAAEEDMAASNKAAPDKRRRLSALRWGLIPSWAKDQSIGYKLINARSETIDTKPSFRSAFRHRRCLILADGYYEWQKAASSARKQPYYIRMLDDSPFALAGLWESWPAGDGSTLESCTIITTEANELTQSIHPRMPVILAPADHAIWLDPTLEKAAGVKELLRPFPSDLMTSFPVSTLVNSPRHDTPECIAPLTE